MIGLKIALFGLVVFLFAMWMPPKSKRFRRLMALLALISLPAMLIGLLMAIWL